MMTYSKDAIEQLMSRYGSPLYIFDEEGFVRNFEHLCSAMSAPYNKYRIAYSFKTNYTPYICSLVKKLGAYAEVVSGMEYALAQKIGYDNQHIIFNGPDKGAEGIEAFLNGCIVNADSLDEFDRYCKIAEDNPDTKYKIGLRVNPDVGQGFVSRFGMDEESLRAAFQKASSIDNLEVAGLHCHISRCRGIAAWEKRMRLMLKLSDCYFEKQPEYIDLGSGMYGSMDPELAAQFDDIPTYEQYATVTSGLMAEHYGADNGPDLFTEPGTTLINRFIECITRIEAIKKIEGCYFAVLDGSVHVLGETCTLKRLPVKVIPGGAKQKYYERIDLTGYTCLEQDVMLPAYNGKLAKGDYIIFGNTGGYSTVLKPPFIRPNCAMVARKKDGTFVLIKQAETYDDIFHTYVFGGQVDE